MALNMYNSDDDPSTDGPSSEGIEHWLDEALRAVPLPDGFFMRMCTLADSPPDRADGRDHSASLLHERRINGGLQRSEASTRRRYPR